MRRTGGLVADPPAELLQLPHQARMRAPVPPMAKWTPSPLHEVDHA
jgi:hypothetical protein